MYSPNYINDLEIDVLATNRHIQDATRDIGPGDEGLTENEIMNIIQKLGQQRSDTFFKNITYMRRGSDLELINFTDMTDMKKKILFDIDMLQPNQVLSITLAGSSCAIAHDTYNRYLFIDTHGDNYDIDNKNDTFPGKAIILVAPAVPDKTNSLRDNKYFIRWVQQAYSVADSAQHKSMELFVYQYNKQ